MEETFRRPEPCRCARYLPPAGPRADFILLESGSEIWGQGRARLGSPSAPGCLDISQTPASWRCPSERQVGCSPRARAGEERLLPAAGRGLLGGSGAQKPGQTCGNPELFIYKDRDFVPGGSFPFITALIPF